MDRRETIAHLAVIAMLGAAVAGLIYGVDITLTDQPGVYMRMPARVGDWEGYKLLYCHDESCGWSGIAKDTTGDVCPACGAPAFTMARVEKEQLPADTQFLKYLYTRPAGDELMVSIVLSGNARSSIHRPQRCLVAQGYNITRSHVESIEIPERPPLDVMILDTLYHFRPPHAPARELPTAYAYWFVGQNRETPRHLVRMFWLAWDRVFHGVAHRWVYIMVHGRTGVSDDAFIRNLRDFIPRWYPAVLRHGHGGIDEGSSHEEGGPR